MRALFSGLGIVGALVPVAYCVGLVVYFGRVGGGTVDGVASIGLGPTVLGLGAIGLLLCIPLFFKILRAVTPPGSPRSGTRSGSDADPQEESGFDADAALARYLAKKEQGLVEPVSSSTEATFRAGFGRKPV